MLYRHGGPSFLLVEGPGSTVFLIVRLLLIAVCFTFQCRLDRVRGPLLFVSCGMLLAVREQLISQFTILSFPSMILGHASTESKSEGNLIRAHISVLMLSARPSDWRERRRLTSADATVLPSRLSDPRQAAPCSHPRPSWDPGRQAPMTRPSGERPSTSHRGKLGT